MTADLSVTATGDGNSRVRAALRAGSGFSTTYVELQAGDTFTASMGGMTQTLSRTQELLAALSYTATFAGDAGPTPVSIALTRARM